MIFLEEAMRRAFAASILVMILLTGAVAPTRQARAQEKVASTALAENWDYAAPMKKIAAKFRGKEGVVLHVGGSMTIANPYGTWARVGKGKTPDDVAILQWM